MKVVCSLSLNVKTNFYVYVAYDGPQSDEIASPPLCLKCTLFCRLSGVMWFKLCQQFLSATIVVLVRFTRRNEGLLVHMYSIAIILNGVICGPY